MSNSIAVDVVQKTPEVLGGDARIRDTRIAVWMLVQARKLGMTDQQIRTQYHPELSREDILAAWRYFDDHPDEILEQIRRNEEA